MYTIYVVYNIKGVVQSAARLYINEVKYYTKCISFLFINVMVIKNMPNKSTRYIISFITKKNSLYLYNWTKNRNIES
jgi:ABC-type long-subunit fatty acid transport system fused permease/ATPase subunit